MRKRDLVVAILAGGALLGTSVILPILAGGDGAACGCIEGSDVELFSKAKGYLPLLRCDAQGDLGCGLIDERRELHWVHWGAATLVVEPDDGMEVGYAPTLQLDALDVGEFDANDVVLVAPTWLGN